MGTFSVLVKIKGIWRVVYTIFEREGGLKIYMEEIPH